MAHAATLAGKHDRGALFRGASLRVVLSYTVVALLLAVAVVSVGDEISHHVRVIESWIASLGPLGIVAFIGLFVASTSVLVPETLLAIVAGALFGLEGGLAAVVAAGFAAASVQFLLSRRVIRARIEKVLASTPRLAAIQHAVAQNEVRLQLLLRLTPLNPATLSYILGAAGVRFSGFLFACIALLPTQLMEVYFGYAGSHVAKMAGRSAPSVTVHDITLLGGLLMCFITMVVVSRMARKAVAGAMAGAAGTAP